jgi:hypothetical protein
MKFTVEIAKFFQLPKSLKQLVLFLKKSESFCCHYIKEWHKKGYLTKSGFWSYVCPKIIYFEVIQTRITELQPAVEESIKLTKIVKKEMEAEKP